MLSTFSGESRLHVVAEQLLRHKVKWVRDRWRIPLKDDGSRTATEVVEVDKTSCEETDKALDRNLVLVEEQFRTQSYRRATRTILCQEFRALSKSTVDAVLAEHNFSYTLAQPTLQELLARTWRNSFSSFLSKWKKPSQEVMEKHYMLTWAKHPEGGAAMVPTLKETGDGELDQELFDTVLKPLLDKRKSEQESKDLEIAKTLNEMEAKRASALYECECCFSDTTFEHMAACTTGTHTICFTCIRHAVNEALFGQSWGLNIDHSRGQVACLAPTTACPCIGCIPQGLAYRAITTSRGGLQTWRKLESRLADEALLKSQAKLVHCPFCTYAELDDLFVPPSARRYRVNFSHPLRTLVLIILPINFLGILLLYSFLVSIARLSLPSPRYLLQTAVTHLTRAKHLSTRFVCRSPTCLRASCLICHKRWRDPHKCYESATLSLRTTVEAARTAALKRTCPRCGLGFVKDSGCNKLVCPCGYVMCYVCRQGLGRGGNRGLVRGGNEEEGEGEGYRHFCQHFRPTGGRCTECDRCDLYRGEDEDEVVGLAGERAEREWREREGMVGVEGLGAVAHNPKSSWEKGAGSKWGVQEAVDWWVAQVIAC